ncbi:MAG: hypothetical protein IPJ89_03895 [Candidatus Iainarchaeum archaeon]|uniref:Fibronectin type-III domain-containing protein n=1 Tax=Candidatus Iainarchaeum sp. TaxID=3101447 RepID=A0A7T9I225_9ARCH|nr:MAG: hypothetical protein IPJ89_03895 [Candidatus Diapherotrites archaeon]
MWYRGIILLFALILLGSALPGFVYAQSISNTMTFTNREPTAITDYPVQVGRPFIQGAYPLGTWPQVVVNGVPVQTQVDVKNRWPDGSMKFAVISFILSSLSVGETKTITFQSISDSSYQSSTGNVLFFSTAMLNNFNFDATIDLVSGGVTQSASARTMLQNNSVAKTWLSGPVVTSLVLADHSANRQYDLGWDPFKSFRPIFNVSFWPGINKYYVMYIGEIANTEAMQDLSYDSVTLKLGQTNPTTVLSQSNVVQHYASRWGRDFWSGAALPKVDIDYGLNYLSATKLIPAFDPAVSVSQSTIVNNYNAWIASNRGLMQQGIFQYTSMGSGGARPELSWAPDWDVRRLFRGSWEAREVSEGMAELAASFPVHFREGDPTKFFDRNPTTGALGTLPAIGRVVSTNARPSVSLYTGFPTYGNPIDEVTPVGPYTHGPLNWAYSDAHVYNPNFISYLLSGRFWDYEELLYWASFASLATGYARGPTTSGTNQPGGGLTSPYGERYQARPAITRLYAAALAEDNSPEDIHFEGLLLDAIVVWRGMQNIPLAQSLPGEPAIPATSWNTQMWQFGRTLYTTATNYNGLFSADLPSPLHQWVYSSACGAGSFVVDPSLADNCHSPWMQAILSADLFGPARDLGYPVQSLMQFDAGWYAWHFTTPDLSPWGLGSYREATTDPNGAPMATPQQVYGAYNASYYALNPGLCFQEGGNLCDAAHGGVYRSDGYFSYQLAATAMLYDFIPDVYHWMRAEGQATFSSSTFNGDPRYGFLPRALFNAAPPTTPIMDYLSINGTSPGEIAQQSAAILIFSGANLQNVSGVQIGSVTFSTGITNQSATGFTLTLSTAQTGTLTAGFMPVTLLVGSTSYAQPFSVRVLSPVSACGSSAPVCNGSCPVGQACQVSASTCACVVIPPTPLPIPNAPANFTATAVTTTSVQLSWSDVANEGHYKLGYHFPPSGSFVLISDLIPANQTTYTHSAAPTGLIQYDLWAYNSQFTSPVTSTTVNTLSASTTPVVTSFVVNGLATNPIIQQSPATIIFSGVNLQSVTSVKIGTATFSSISAQSSTGFTLTLTGTQTGTLGIGNLSLELLTSTTSYPQTSTIQVIAPLQQLQFNSFQPVTSIAFGSPVTFSGNIINTVTGFPVTVEVRLVMPGSSEVVVSSIPLSGNSSGLAFSYVHAPSTPLPIDDYQWRIGVSQLGTTTYSNYFDFDVVSAPSPGIFSITAVEPLPGATITAGSAVPFSAMVYNANQSEALNLQLYASTQQTEGYLLVYESGMTAAPGGTLFSTVITIPGAVSGSYWWFFAVTNSSTPSSTVTTPPSQITFLLACGNNSCEAPTETCSTCPSDCGSCTTGSNPTTNNSAGGAGGGGGGGSGSGGSGGSSSSAIPNTQSGNGSVSQGGSVGNDQIASTVEQNPVLSLVNGIGSGVVGAFSADAAQNYATNLVVGVVILLAMLGAAAYFLGFI